jgi:hypothetical protein
MNSQIEKVYRENTIECEWVIARLKGKDAQYVKALASNGTGYFVRQESGAGPNYQIEVAFKRPIHSPIPEHLQKADSIQVQKLNKLDDARKGELEKKS